MEHNTVDPLVGKSARPLGRRVLIPAIALVLLALHDERAAFTIYRCTTRQDYADGWARRIIEREAFRYYRRKVTPRARREDAA